MADKDFMQQLMQQAQQIQQSMEKAQSELSHLLVVGEAGGGLIKIEMNGQHIAQRVHLSGQLLKEELPVIASLITAAVNDCTKKVEEAARGKIANLAEGIPGPKDLFGGKESTS